MCVKELVRKICAIFGVFGEMSFLMFTCGFHLPFSWYLKAVLFGTLYEVIGGLWTYCYVVVDKLDSDWKCDEIDKDYAE